MSTARAARYCADRVRRLDRDRYLVGLFAPDRVRPTLMALYAFNIELSRIADTVSEPLLGRIRLQWWREAVAGLYDASGVRAHAVVEELARAVDAHGLSRFRLERMIDAREQDLAEAAFADLAALEAYAAATSGGLSELTAEALGVSRGRSVSAAANAGIAWGLTGLLRALPYHAARRRLFLPRDLLDGAGITAVQVFSSAPPAALAKAVAPVAAAARAHVRRARSSAVAGQRVVLLPLALAAAWLNRLERRGFDVFARGLEPPPLWRLLGLTLAAIRSR